MALNKILFSKASEPRVPNETWLAGCSNAPIVSKIKRGRHIDIVMALLSWRQPVTASQHRVAPPTHWNKPTFHPCTISFSMCQKYVSKYLCYYIIWKTLKQNTFFQLYKSAWCFSFTLCFRHTKKSLRTWTRPIPFPSHVLPRLLRTMTSTTSPPPVTSPITETSTWVLL